MEEGRRATGGHEGPLLHERGWPNPKIQSIDRSAVLLAACSNQKYSGLGSPRADLANPFHAQGWDGSAGGGAAWRLGHSECTHRDAHPHSALPARPPPPSPPCVAQHAVAAKLHSTPVRCSRALTAALPASRTLQLGQVKLSMPGMAKLAQDSKKSRKQQAKAKAGGKE